MTPEKVKIEEKVVYQEKTDKTKETDTEKKKQVVTVKTEETKPDGTKTIVTRTEENTDIARTTLSKEQIDKTLTEERSKLVEMGRNRVTISALGGLDLTDLKKSPTYGGHISKPLLGPIAMGVWGLSSGTGGVSLGLQF